MPHRIGADGNLCSRELERCEGPGDKELSGMATSGMNSLGEERVGMCEGIEQGANTPTHTGPRDPTDVLSQHAGLRDPNQDAARV